MSWVKSGRDNYTNFGNVGIFRANNVSNSINMSGNGKAIINGVEYDIPSNASILTKNGEVYINGEKVSGKHMEKVAEIKIEIHGNVKNADIGNSLTVHGNIENADVGNSITVNGDIKGNADAGNNIMASKIYGKCDAGNNIMCR